MNLMHSARGETCSYLCLSPNFTPEHLNTGRSFTKRGSVPSSEEDLYAFTMMLGDGISHLSYVKYKEKIKHKKV